MTKTTAMPSKQVPLRLWTLILSVGPVKAMYTGAHYALDEAYKAAKESVRRRSDEEGTLDTVPKEFIESPDIVMWESQSIEDVFGGTNVKIYAPDNQKLSFTDRIDRIKYDKNQLMRDIIENKSTGAFNRAKNIFSVAETKLLADALKKK